MPENNHINDFREYKIKDDAFDINFISQYHLFIKIGQTDLGICVFDPDRGSCVLLENYAITHLGESIFSQLHTIWTQHHFLNAAFWASVNIVLSNNRFAVSPQDYTDGPISPADILPLNTPFSSTQEDAHSWDHEELGLTISFSVMKELKKWFAEVYPNANCQYIHNTACFIKGLSPLYPFANHHTIFINVEKEWLTVVHTRNEKLLFLNHFNYSDKNDFLYYVLLVLDELHIGQAKAKVVVWGETESQDEKIALLQEYVGEIAFGQRPSGVKFAYPFDQIPDHYQFDLISAY